MAIDPEAVDRDAMNRRFLGVVPVGAHAERAAGDEEHVLIIRRVSDTACDVRLIDGFSHQVIHG